MHKAWINEISQPVFLQSTYRQPNSYPTSHLKLSLYMQFMHPESEILVLLGGILLLKQLHSPDSLVSLCIIFFNNECKFHIASDFHIEFDFGPKFST